MKALIRDRIGIVCSTVCQTVRSLRGPYLALMLVLPGGVAIGAEPVDYDALVADLAGTHTVARALEAIDVLEADSLEPLIELTEIEAPPFEEENRAIRFAAMLEEAGIRNVSMDTVGNVLGLWQGDGRPETVAVVAHLDTVFPAGTDVRVKAGEPANDERRWYAPGIGDNARGLVLLLNLVRSMIEAGVHTEKNVLFVGSVGEEGIGDLRGVKHLLREGGPRIDEFIAIDGSNDARVLNRAIGSHRYRISVLGPGGHSWGAFGLANPAHALAQAVHEFDTAAEAFVASGPRTTYSVGRIGGGTSVNAIPFETWVEVDLRSESASRLEAIDELLRESFARAVDRHNERRDRGEALTLEFEMIGDRPSGVVDPATPLIQRALAVARYLSLEPALGSGSTDANVPIARGVPATTISRGGASGGAHSLGEWWSDRDVTVGSKKALLLVLASAGVRDSEG
jgi:acetylornithine deacetylase/succinyl-diaminopimelate desuccinylase-like protein